MCNSFLVLVLGFILNFNIQIDAPSIQGKRITDSLSKIYNKKVIGYTTINKQITHIKYIKKGREFELSLTGFRIETPVVIEKKKKN